MNPTVVFNTSLRGRFVVCHGGDADYRTGRKSLKRDAPLDHSM
jgi:hypothetical protein